MNSLSIVFNLLSQVTRLCESPDESLARDSIYLQPVTGCKSGVRARVTLHPTSPIPLGKSCYQLLALCVCSLLVY